jgi:Ca-activated chloride channel family protein
MKVSVKLDLEKLVYDKDGNVNLMTTLESPDVAKDTKRNSLSICAVIDRSGSMSERGGSMIGSKMDYVKKSMYKLIDHMTENDSLAIVFFDNTVENIEFKKMTSSNKEVMKQEIARVQPRGSTDMGSAILAAGKLFANYEGNVKSVERIMLLTDGEANIGASTSEHFEPIVTGIRRGVTLSCIGYGDKFNEDLLTSVAKTGKGNNYYIETPDNVSKVFAVELGSLLTCYAQEIILSFKTHKGVCITNVLNDMDVSTNQDADGELVTDVKVGDIFAGERRDVLLKMSVEKRPQALPRPVTLADVTISYRTMKDSLVQEEKSKVKVSFVKTNDEATKTPDKEIAEQVAILEAANVVAQAKKMADEGNWLGAQTFLRNTAATLKETGGEKAGQYADGMYTLSANLNSSYTAGSAGSKSMGYYSSSTTASRGIGLIGNQADSLGGAPVMNCVMSSLVADFSDKDNVDSGQSAFVLNTLTGNKKDGEDSVDPLKGFSKTKKS